MWYTICRNPQWKFSETDWPRIKVSVIEEKAKETKRT